MPKLTIDGREVEVAAGTNLIEAARAAGVAIPYFCYHPYLSVVGQCRICLVEIEGQPRLAIGCATPAVDGMVVRSETSQKVRDARNAVMEFLLLNHPLDCPVCDQAGECLLQDHSFDEGLDTTHMVETRRTFPGYERRLLGPHIIQNQNRCIHCSRCIRFCQEISETGQLTYKSRGNHTFIATHDGRPFDDPFSGCAADVCPVGALTIRGFRFKKRAWKLRSTPSVCPGCSIGCTTWIDHHERVVLRFTPRENAGVNATWLCDHGRFLAESLNRHELLHPQHRVAGALQRVPWPEAMRELGRSLKAAHSFRVVASGYLSNEELYLAKALFAQHLKGDIVVPTFPGTTRRMKNGAGKWLTSTDAPPNVAGARRLGLKVVDGEGLARFLYGGADLTVILDPDAHPDLATEEALQLLRVGSTMVFARLQHPVTELASWLLPAPSQAADEGSYVASTGAVQRFQPAFAPPGETRPGLQILAGLARELGVAALDLPSPADVFARLAQTEKGFRGLTWDNLAGPVAVPGGSKTMLAELAVVAAKLGILAGIMLTAVPVMTWVERRGAAFIQDRLGPNRVGPWGLFQPIIDAVKLFFKEDVTPSAVNRGLYYLAPMISLFIALVTFIVIPFGAGSDVTVFGVPLGGLTVASDLEVGVLYLLALSSLGVYGIVLAGWSSNNKYSLLGGLRSSAQLISYELSMTLAVLGVVLSTGSLRLDKVVTHQADGLWNAVPQALGFIVFLTAAFAETNRLPFDLAEGETELVAGYHVEYSSMKFAAYMMAEYINMVTASALLVTLYLGGWSLPGVHLAGWTGLAVSVAVFGAKVCCVLWLFVWVRWSLPRFRYDQLMRLGWKGLLPLAIVNLTWVAVGIAMKWKWV